MRENWIFWDFTRWGYYDGIGQEEGEGEETEGIEYDLGNEGYWILVLADLGFAHFRE